MTTKRDRQALIDESIEHYRKVLERSLPDNNATLEQVEDAIKEIGKVVLPRLQEQLVNERSKTSRENTIKCSCGGLARYRNTTSRKLITQNGLLVWQRPVYYCSSCHQGFAPLDATLGLDKGDTTPGVREAAAILSAKMGFAESSEILKKLCDIEVSASTVERIAVSVGRSLRASQVADAELHKKDALPDQRTACPTRLYITQVATYPRME